MSQTKAAKNSANRPPKQRPPMLRDGNENSTNFSTSGHVSPVNSDHRASGAAGGGSNTNQANYEPIPGGTSPRAHQVQSTLDEINNGSTHRRNDPNNSYVSGQQSPKLTKPNRNGDHS